MGKNNFTLETFVMDIPEFLSKLLNMPFKFWCCSNKEHKRVTWNEDGTQATCDECGETSPIVEEENIVKSYDIVIKPVDGSKDDEFSILIDAKNIETAHYLAQTQNPDHVVLRELTKVFK